MKKKFKLEMNSQGPSTYMSSLNQIGSFSNELEWIYYQLWLKSSQGLPKPFSFKIADTVFFDNQQRKPQTWYFTSKEGFVLKKNKQNVTAKNIHSDFTKKQAVGEPITATGYFFDAQNMREIQMEHVPQIDFRSAVFFREQEKKPLILQKFTNCPQKQNSMYKVLWTPLVCHIEKRQNIFDLADKKSGSTLQQRVVTFEGPESSSYSETVHSQVVQDLIKEAIREIAQHINDCNPVLKLKGGVFYFKVNQQSDLVFKFCTNLKVEKGQEPFLEEHPECKLKLYDGNPYSSVNIEQQSNYSSKQSKASRPQSSHPVRKQLCPFCTQTLKVTDAFEFTIQNVIKLFTHFKDTSGRLLEIPEGKLDFNKNLKDQIDQNQEIPLPIQKVCPQLSSQKYKEKQRDPLFIYESFRCCNSCQLSMKQLIELVNKEIEEAVKSKHQSMRGSICSQSSGLRSKRSEQQEKHKSRIQSAHHQKKSQSSQKLPNVFPYHQNPVQKESAPFESDKEDSPEKSIHEERKRQKLRKQIDEMKLPPRARISNQQQMQQNNFSLQNQDIAMVKSKEATMTLNSVQESNEEGIKIADASIQPQKELSQSRIVEEESREVEVTQVEAKKIVGTEQIMVYQAQTPALDGDMLSDSKFSEQPLDSEEESETEEQKKARMASFGFQKVERGQEVVTQVKIQDAEIPQTQIEYKQKTLKELRPQSGVPKTTNLFSTKNSQSRQVEPQLNPSKTETEMILRFEAQSSQFDLQSQQVQKQKKLPKGFQSSKPQRLQSAKAPYLRKEDLSQERKVAGPKIYQKTIGNYQRQTTASSQKRQKLNQNQKWQKEYEKQVQQLSDSVKQEILDVVDQIENSYSAIDDDQSKQIEQLKQKAGILGDGILVNQPKTTLSLFSQKQNPDLNIQTQSLRHLKPINQAFNKPEDYSISQQLPNQKKQETEENTFKPQLRSRKEVRATYFNPKDMIRLAQMKEQKKQELLKEKKRERSESKTKKKTKRPQTAKRRTIIGQERRQVQQQQDQFSGQVNIQKTPQKNQQNILSSLVQDAQIDNGSIQKIAENADVLIGIIQNIKEQHQPVTQQPAILRRNIQSAHPVRRTQLEGLVEREEEEEETKQQLEQSNQDNLGMFDNVASSMISPEQPSRVEKENKEVEKKEESWW